MKAAIYRKYGPPSVVEITEVQRPIIQDHQLLIEIHASTVNRTDTGFRSAEYVISRFWSGLFKPKQPILGCEFAGVVIETGSKVTKFKVGDRVFGYNDKQFGGHAEYIAVNESDHIGIIPERLNFAQAAAMTEGSHYALVDIRVARVEAGHNVMVYGATGAIGTAAIQLLKHYGAHVTAVGNTKNVQLMKDLGADVVIDYQKQDYTQTKQKFHFIFDAVGKSSYKLCKPMLTDLGVYISTEFGKNGINIWLALTSFARKKKLLFPLPLMTQEDIDFLSKLATNNEFTPVIDTIYPLDEIIQAHIHAQSGQKTGNVILQVKS
jgi:NADPH:quinone reductase-like Zn-dependent oxidoreductase